MPRSWTDFVSTVGIKPRILNDPAAGGEFSGTLDDGGLNHVVTWLLDVRDLAKFLAFAMGMDGTGRNPRLSSPFLPGVVAVGCGFGGKPGNARISDAYPWASATVTVQFGWLPFGTDGSQPYLSVRWRGSSNLITIHNTNSKFANSPEVIDFDSGLWVASVGVETTFHQLRNWGPSLATVMGLMGKVNANPITLDGFSFAAGSLLLPTFDAEKATSMLGSPQQSLTVPLAFRAIPWNSGVRSDGVVDGIVKADGTPFYPTGDFSTLGGLS